MLYFPVSVFPLHLNTAFVTVVVVVDTVLNIYPTSIQNGKLENYVAVGCWESL